MKSIFKTLALSAALVAGTASAAVINVGGVSWDPDSPFDFQSTDSMFEGAVTNIGDSLNGYGLIATINGQPNFCAGCELTYQFSGYTLAAISPAGDFTFTGGTFQVYVDSTPNWNPLLASTAGDGILWLSLAGHSHLDIPTGNIGTIHSDPTPSGAGADLAGDGRGYLDVTGGLAAAYFDTNSQSLFDSVGVPGFADFQFTSSFQLLRVPFLSDDLNTYEMFGSNDLQGDSIAIPEPGSMALLGLALAGLGFTQRRRNAAK